MTFKKLALKVLKEYPDRIWVYFNDDNPNKSKMDSEVYLDVDSLDDFAYDMLVVTLKG